MSRNSMIEGLESRTLLSATPTPVLFNSTVAIDRLHVKIDLLKFQVDIFTNDARLSADRHRIVRNTPAGDTSLNAGFTQLETDNASLQSQLKTDRLNDQTITVAQEAIIKEDIIQIKKDKGNSTAETADHAKLMADRITLQNDLVTGLDARITLRQSFETTIANDTQAIVTAADADTHATPKMLAAVDKFAADRVHCIDKLTSDLTTIENARQKLANDLTAEQSM